MNTILIQKQFKFSIDYVLKTEKFTGQLFWEPQ